MDTKEELVNKQKFNIIGLGEILWDIYDNDKFLGGAPANFAIHCQQLGNDGIVVSRIGNDTLGDEIKTALEKRNLITDYLQIDSQKPTGTVQVSLDEKGKPQFICTKDVAFDYLQFNGQLENLARQTDAVLFGTLAQRNSVSGEVIQKFVQRASRAIKIYDINLRGWDSATRKVVFQSLELANAIKLNDEELTILKNVLQPHAEDIDFLKFLMEKYNLKLAALTLGENGCILMDLHDVIKIKGINIKPVDTTGCGDAFAAGMIHQFLRGKPLYDVAFFSNLIGAYVALFAGATPLYALDELEQFRKEISILQK